MDELDLDDLLQLRRNAPLPNLPSSVRQGVRCAIEKRSAVPKPWSHAWMEWLLEPLLKPAVVATALVLACMVGVGLGSATFDNAHARTRFALNLQVFGNASPALPATLLSRTE